MSSVNGVLVRYQPRFSYEQMLQLVASPGATAPPVLAQGVPANSNLRYALFASRRDDKRNLYRALAVLVLKRIRFSEAISTLRFSAEPRTVNEFATDVLANWLAFYTTHALLSDERNGRLFEYGWLDGVPGAPLVPTLYHVVAELLRFAEAAKQAGLMSGDSVAAAGLAALLRDSWVSCVPWWVFRAQLFGLPCDRLGGPPASWMRTCAPRAQEQGQMDFVTLVKEMSGMNSTEEHPAFMLTRTAKKLYPDEVASELPDVNRSLFGASFANFTALFETSATLNTVVDSMDRFFPAAWLRATWKDYKNDIRSLLTRFSPDVQAEVPQEAKATQEAVLKELLYTYNLPDDALFKRDVDGLRSAFHAAQSGLTPLDTEGLRRIKIRFLLYFYATSQGHSSIGQLESALFPYVLNARSVSGEQWTSDLALGLVVDKNMCIRAYQPAVVPGPDGELLDTPNPGTRVNIALNGKYHDGSSQLADLYTSAYKDGSLVYVPNGVFHAASSGQAPSMPLLFAKEPDDWKQAVSLINNDFEYPGISRNRPSTLYAVHVVLSILRDHIVRDSDEPVNPTLDESPAAKALSYLDMLEKTTLQIFLQRFREASLSIVSLIPKCGDRVLFANPSAPSSSASAPASGASTSTKTVWFDSQFDPQKFYSYQLQTHAVLFLLLLRGFSGSRSVTKKTVRFPCALIVERLLQVQDPSGLKQMLEALANCLLRLGNMEEIVSELSEFGNEIKENITISPDGQKAVCDTGDPDKRGRKEVKEGFRLERPLQVPLDEKAVLSNMLLVSEALAGSPLGGTCPRPKDIVSEVVPARVDNLGSKDSVSLQGDKVQALLGGIAAIQSSGVSLGDKQLDLADKDVDAALRVLMRALGKDKGTP